MPRHPDTSEKLKIFLEIEKSEEKTKNSRKRKREKKQTHIDTNRHGESTRDILRKRNTFIKMTHKLSVTRRSHDDDDRQNETKQKNLVDEKCLTLWRCFSDQVSRFKKHIHARL